MSTGARKAYDVWMQMVRNRDQLGRTVLEMLAHPQATQEQIMSAAGRYRRVTASMREVQPKVVQALYAKNENHAARTVAESLSTRRSAWPGS